jgi:nitrogenase subunit NifH
VPNFYEKYAGSVLCLATTDEPDTSTFNAPEIVKRMKKHHHAGLIVCSESAGRVRELVDQYSAEFAQRFLAALPPPEKPTA